MSVQVGDALKLQATFTVSDVATDPTTITLEVQDPSGNTDSYTYAGGGVTKTSTGIYYRIVTFDEAGTWIYQWTATGAVVTVEGDKIYVDEALL